MKEVIRGFTDQLQAGYKLGTEKKLDREYDDYVIAGIGGAIVAGEILWMLTSEQNKDSRPKVFINRDYDLPGWIDKSSLVICMSWSGNTEETISALSAAIDRGLPVVVISKGGKMIDMAKERGVPYVDLEDDNFPARLGAGYELGALLGILGIELGNVSIDQDRLEKEAKIIAESIGKRTPLMYSSFKWRKLAGFWKTLFNENAKVPAAWNYFPALNHNELEGLAASQNSIHPIIIRDQKDDPRIAKSIEATIAILTKLGYTYSTVNVSPSSSLLEKVLENYIFGLWTSFYLAESLGIAPAPTPIIDEYKRARNN